MITGKSFEYSLLVQFEEKMKDYGVQQILFKNIEYPIKSISLPKIGKINISVESLNEKLLNKNNGYVSKYAKYIDEQIFFFVKDDLIYKNNVDLKKILNKEVLW